MDERILVRTLQVDGLGTPLFAVGALVAAAPIAEAIGVSRSWPIAVLSAALVVYGIDNLSIARRPRRATVVPLVAVDLGFAVAMLAIAAGDPWGATTLGRVGLVGLGLASATMGTLKWLGLPTAAAASAATDRRHRVVAG